MKRLAFAFLWGTCAFAGGAAGVVLVPHLVSPVVAQPGRLSPDAMQRVGDRFAWVAARVGPAVVTVEATKPAEPGARGESKRSTEEAGSGVIVKLDNRPGYFVITNNHVVAKSKPNQVTLFLADGRVLHPTQIWADPESDVALLRIQGENLQAAPLGDSSRMQVGHWVLAIGSPFGLNQTVTHGILSARDRGQVSLGDTIRIKDFLQTDTAINPGSSGGPLLNLEGEVIGINTAIASQSGSHSGVAFSIPINLVKRVSAQLLEKGTVRRGYLGLQLSPTIDADDARRLGLSRVTGALVEAVFRGTPAARAGLQADDVVVQLEGLTIRNENHLINLVSTLPVGQKVRMNVWRNRRLVQVEAVIGDWAKAQGQFGGR